MNIKITSDSTCDLSPSVLEQYGILITPLTIVKEGGYFRDGIDITPEDIFRHVENGGALCTTSAVNVAEYEAFFAPLAQAYDAVIHITLGSGFSSCYQNACIAAEEFTNVHIVDSQNLSCGHGAVVMEACRLAQTCTDVDALCEELRALTQRVECSFLLDRLDYMVKGGRCSSVLALGANLLKLKPCIEVINGKMQVVKKYRGTFGKCIALYARDRLEERADLCRETLYMPTAELSGEELETARASVVQFGAFRSVMESKAGCTISCHCGPHCVGLMYLRNKERQ